MPFSHGSRSKFFMTDAVAVMTELSAYLRSAELTEAADTAETSTLGTTDKTYIPGLKDNKFALEGQFDPIIDALLSAANGDPNFRTFNYYPQGNASGRVMYAGTGFITNYKISGSVSAVQAVTADFQVNGAVTRSIVP